MTIKISGLILLVLLVCTINKSSLAQTKKQSKVITSTTDANGNQHPASLGISGSGTATCVLAAGGSSTTPSCFINNQIVYKDNSVGVTKTVTLTCNGQAPLKCQARVEW